MNDFYERINEVFAGLNLTVCLSIAGGVAVLLIGLLVYDSLRRKRNGRRFHSRSGNSERHGNRIGNSYRNFRSTFRELGEEMERRRRHTDRERGRRK